MECDTRMHFFRTNIQTCTNKNILHHAEQVNDESGDVLHTPPALLLSHTLSDLEQISDGWNARVVCKLSEGRWICE